MYKYILFDMDGTVLNTLQDLKNAANFILNKYNMPLIDDKRAAHSLGNGSKYFLSHSVPEGTEPELIEKMLEEYLPYYLEHCRIDTAPYTGIVELMRRLRDAGMKMAVVSNKPDGAVKALAKEFFPGLLETAIGETSDIKRKPAPDTVLEAMKNMGADKESSVYIGDTEVDLMTAKNAGIECISVSWGFRSADELIAAGACTVVDTPAELGEIMNSI